MKALTLCALLVPLAALADSPFDGTWVSSEESSSMSGKPYKISLAKGVWESDATAPPIKIKADGTDQPVKGHDYFDTVSVKETGPTSAELASKKGGKLIGTSAFAVSPDGKTLTVKWSDMTGTEPVTGESTLQREGAAPKGANAVSGAWQRAKLQSVSANGRTVTLRSTADGLSMSSPTGQSYTAKFDGKDVPIDGDPGGTTASLKRVNDHTIVETDKRHGKVVEVDHMTVAKDGKSMKVDWDNPQTHRKGTYVMNKQ